MSANDEEIANQKPTRVSPRNINFVNAQNLEESQKRNAPMPIHVSQSSLIRMDIFKQMLASTEKLRYKKISNRVKSMRYNEQVDKCYVKQYVSLDLTTTILK